MTNYLFIDGGYLKKAYSDSVKEWFGNEGELDFQKVIKTFGSVSKTFYYDCEDKIRRNKETESTFNSRVVDQEAFFNSIREIPGCHVRLGHLIGSSEKRKRQKEVDIKLTVDVMNHAIRHNMDRAILLTGDRDFKPLVESLVDMGIYVELAADEKSISQDLAYSADWLRKLTFEIYHSWSIASLQSSYPINDIQRGVAPPHDAVLIKEGNVSGYPITLHKSQGNNFFYLHSQNYKKKLNIGLACNELARLELFFKLQFGRIQWTSTQARA